MCERLAQKLHRLVRRAEAGEKQQEQLVEQQRILYQQLISSTEQMVRQARQVTTSLLEQAEKSAQSLVEKVEPLLPLVELDEVEGGIITRYQILSHPDEHEQGLQALSHHLQLFGHPPRLLAGDRGVHIADTELKALTAGVQIVAIPGVGKISVIRQAVEHSRRWKRGYRWRAGIEGRIASLRRDYGLRKSAHHGQDGMERWIGLGVIASNLRHIAQAQGIKKAKKRAA